MLFRSNHTSHANADRIADSSATPRDRIGTDVEAKGDVSAATKAPTALDGTALKVKVKSALLADRGVAALDIHVDTNAGVVTLAGEVESTEMRNRAVEIAEATPGVVRVVDQLIVKAA